MGRVFRKQWRPGPPRSNYCTPVSLHDFSLEMYRHDCGQGKYMVVRDCRKCGMRINVVTRKYTRSLFKPLSKRALKLINSPLHRSAQSGIFQDPKLPPTDQ